jgi:hypothetical protein
LMLSNRSNAFQRNIVPVTVDVLFSLRVSLLIFSVQLLSNQYYQMKKIKWVGRQKWQAT